MRYAKKHICSPIMASLRAFLSAHRPLFILLLLLSLPLIVNVNLFPDSLAAQEYAFSLLTPCDGLGLCSLCGEVLEMVDSAQRTLANPFQDELILSSTDWHLSGMQTYQRCLHEPLLRGCDTLVQKVQKQRFEFAKSILENIMEDSNFRLKWGVWGEEYIVRNALSLSNYIFDLQESAMKGQRDLEKEDGAAQNIIYQSSTLSLGGDPEVDPLVTRVWFLRRDVFPLHAKFCFPFCEEKLGMLGRMRLTLARLYVRYGIKTRLQLLREYHRGTLVIAQIIMISFTACLDRMMPPLSGSGGGGLGGDTRCSTSPNNGGVTQSSTGGLTAGGISAGGGGGDGNTRHNGSPSGYTSGKGHYRQGRRR